MLLDEIGDLPIGLQVKLLRALETKEILPVGATMAIKVDIRIIAATNRRLEDELAAGRFREDLFYRLNVFGIRVPPLRERREDIPPLVTRFIRNHNKELRKKFKGADSATLKAFMALPWKGNVRELDNVIEHAMIIGDGEWITPEDLPGSLVPEGMLPSSPSDNLRAAVHTYERAHIQSILLRSENDKRTAAECLGISLSSLYRKLEELDIPLGCDAPS